MIEGRNFFSESYAWIDEPFYIFVVGYWLCSFGVKIIWGKRGDHWQWLTFICDLYSCGVRVTKVILCLADFTNSLGSVIYVTRSWRTGSSCMKWSQKLDIIKSCSNEQKTTANTIRNSCKASGSKRLILLKEQRLWYVVMYSVRHTRD